MPRPTRFQEVSEALARRIRTGELRPGEWLPSEAALCREYGLSRSCVRRALGELKSAGLVESRRGRGCRVVARTAGEGWGDVALAMGVNFADWSLSIATCMLYSLLEQETVQHGCRFVHVQLDWTLDADELLDRLAVTGCERFILDLAVFDRIATPAYFLERLNRRGGRGAITSFVTPHRWVPCDQVYADWRAGTRDAARYLLENHAGTLLYAGCDGVDWSDERRGVFLAAMRQAGRWQPGLPAPCVPYPEPIRWELPGRPHGSVYERAAGHLLDRLRQTPADAVLCANDRIVECLARQASPGELPRLVGFDNSLWAAQQGISSVGMNLRRHADALLERLCLPADSPPASIPVATLFTPRHERL